MKSVVPGMPAAEYHAQGAISSSLLKAMQRSPAHARERALHPEAPTKALTVGDALHAAVFEPERYSTEYVVAPKVDRRTKDGKETWARFELEHPHATLLKDDEGDLVENMASSVRSHPRVAEILAEKHAIELSAFWLDEETGAQCKARADLIGRAKDWPVIVDLKSTVDASPRGFPREALRYGYHIQAAWYLDGFHAVAPLERRFLFIAVEKEPPYCAAVYEFDIGSQELGRTLARRALRDWVECEKNGVWPGYPAGLNELNLPAWAFRGDENA